MSTKNVFYIKGDGIFEYEVTSKAVHQKALKLICGNLLKPGQKKDEIAVLKFEGNHYLNDHDIIIEIGSKKVGHLSNADTLLITKHLNQDVVENQVLICNAKIMAEKKSILLNKLTYQVVIDLPVRKSR